MRVEVCYGREADGTRAEQDWREVEMHDGRNEGHTLDKSGFEITESLVDADRIAQLVDSGDDSLRTDGCFTAHCLQGILILR